MPSRKEDEVRVNAAWWRYGVSALALGAVMAGAPAFGQQDEPVETGQEPEDEDFGSDVGQSAMEVIQVTGIRSALSSAQDIKQNADVVVDSITAEDIGALADRSVTEALQRVPGVSIDRFQAGNDPDHFSIEGSGVVVRGLTWVRSEFNGRDTFSANNGRSLSFADVPPELLGGVDVFKSPSADMIEGGISGTINLRTRVPFDAPDRVIAGSVEGSYGDFSEEWAPTYSALYSDRWETGAGEFGLLVNYVDSELKARSDGQQISNFGPRTLYSNDDVVATDGATEVGPVFFPRGASFRSQEFDRERKGYGAAAQWRSNDGTMEATAQFLRSDSSQAWTERAIEIATDNVADNGDSRAVPGTSLDFGPDGVFTRGMITSDNTGYRDDQFGPNPRVPAWGLQSNNIRRDVLQDYVTSDYGLNFKWTPNDKWSFNFDFQHVDSTVDVLDFAAWNSGYQNANIELRGDDIPLVEFLPVERRIATDAPENAGGLCDGEPASQFCPNYLQGNGYSDPSNAFSRAFMDHIEQSEGTLDAFKFDADYTFDDGKFIRGLRFGGRRAERDQTTRFTTYNWGRISEQWGGGGPVWLDESVPGLESPLGSYHETFEFDNFMRGDVPSPTQGDPRLFWGSNIVENYDEYSEYGVTVSDFWNAEVDENGCSANWRPLAGRCDVVQGTPFQPQEINPVTEETNAFYAMADFGHDFANGVELAGNFGLRYVDMQRTAEGFRAFPQQSFTTEAECAAGPDEGQEPQPFCELDPQVRADARAFSDGTLVENDAEHSEEHWLPSFNAVARLENGIQFRFGFSQAITPPDIGLTRNYYNIGLSTNEQDIIDGEPTGRFSVGNPFLEPIKATNFDLTGEWYFSEVGQLTVSFFYKELEDVITNGTERLEFTNKGATFDAVVTTPQNSESTGEVKGFEIAYQQTYDFLPEPFDGFGLNANYTYVESGGVEQSTLNPTDPDVSAGNVSNIDVSLLPLEGLSEHTVNLAGFYEKGPVELRLAYAWRSEFVLTVRDEIVPFAPIIQEASGQLDGSAFYSINDNIRVGVQAVNLTNEVTRTSQVLNDDLLTAPRSWFMNDRRYSVVLRANF